MIDRDVCSKFAPLQQIQAQDESGSLVVEGVFRKTRRCDVEIDDNAGEKHAGGARRDKVEISGWPTKNTESLDHFRS